ncbi:hypothetical protein LENED_000979 [Lentinula edodes]|uniref:Uncharacterized protein n=1 Tax=Lentinula edodes TaxID=5353 RepID=A0A1Q3DX54_LENED|nr:hypothetical protein LENED_000979 [Lentinula edodes]
MKDPYNTEFTLNPDGRVAIKVYTELPLKEFTANTTIVDVVTMDEVKGPSSIIRESRGSAKWIFTRLVSAYRRCVCEGWRKSGICQSICNNMDTERSVDSSRRAVVRIHGLILG